MSVFRHFSQKIIFTNLKTPQKFYVNNTWSLYFRCLSHQPILYDGKSDPGPIFIKSEVQSLLKTLTRVDLSKVFRRRKWGEKKLSQPVYKFMTDEELKEALKEAHDKVHDMLQIPPVVSTRKPKDKIISKDPALQGLDESVFVFTDITYGIRDSRRIILVRDMEGTLKEADWETRDRMNQMFFPDAQRQVKIPKMFLQDDLFEDLLKRGEYNFVLDRACLQFEPNDPLYQKIVSVTYQHINENNKFDDIRSTRHFGGFAFFLAWNKIIDNLLIELIESEHADEATALVDLYSHIHKIKFEAKENLDRVKEYIDKYSSKKGALELALQAYKSAQQRKEELEEGIKKAHGHV